VPVPRPLAEIQRRPGGFGIVFRGLEPDATWRFEEAGDPAGPWLEGESFTGSETWSMERPHAGSRRFFRAVGPARLERLVLPPP
jgi:hypothetical protein